LLKELRNLSLASKDCFARLVGDGAKLAVRGRSPDKTELLRIFQVRAMSNHRRFDRAD
jgi:hypothetical protein